MYDYDEISLCKVSDKVRFNRHFEFINMLEKYKDNITINETLNKKLLNNKITANEYSQLNEMIDGCIFHLNRTLEFNKKNGMELNHHYIINYSSNIFRITITYKIIDEKEFRKCNLFFK